MFRKLALSIGVLVVFGVAEAFASGMSVPQPTKPNPVSVTRPAKVAPKQNAVRPNAVRPNAVRPNAVQLGQAQLQDNLNKINGFRAKRNLPPLTLDPQLSDFAIAGSQELMANPSPDNYHKHWYRIANQKDPSGTSVLLTRYGFRNPCTETQHYWRFGPPPSVNEQIDKLLQDMWDEGPENRDGRQHGHYEAIMNPNYTRVGVGLTVDANGQLYLTNDFSA